MSEYQFVDITNTNILEKILNIWLQNCGIIRHILFPKKISFRTKISITLNKIQRVLRKYSITLPRQMKILYTFCIISRWFPSSSRDQFIQYFFVYNNFKPWVFQKFSHLQTFNWLIKKWRWFKSEVGKRYLTSNFQTHFPNTWHLRDVSAYVHLLTLE